MNLVEISNYPENQFESSGLLTHEKITRMKDEELCEIVKVWKDMDSFTA